jgi:hypothetical protein
VGLRYLNLLSLASAPYFAELDFDEVHEEGGVDWRMNAEPGRKPDNER